MKHVAILKKGKVKKGDNLLQNIVDGTKTIESRWYVNKISPWNKIQKSDIVYFKETGKQITAKAEVEKILGKKKYCILIFLKNARPVTPFTVDKKGFGSACAWLCGAKLPA